MILNGTEKSALLLMAIGAEQAGEVLKNLTPFEIQELITSMVNIKRISTKKLHEILLECYDIAIKNNTFNDNNSDEYLLKMLTEALGEKKGSALLQEALEVRNAKISIQALNYMDPKKIAFLLKNEHLQIITTILVFLNNNQSAQILSFFNNEKRAEIILRITEFHGIEENILIELNKVIKNLLSNKKLILSEKGGVKTAAKILNSMQIKEEKDILKKLSIFSKKIAKSIINEIFLFENIVDIDDKYIKIVISNLEKEKLCIALRNTTQAIKEKFFKNMPEQESKNLALKLDESSYISDVSIQNEQKLILIMIQNIIKNGDISLENLREYYV
ncbi:flagellar motor switch protein FliG [Buchnera aphidicola (Macrosiphoniella sanborni)]|uniref:Flagellar motor switch protein FliG n=1 Tax=Buchnera aphidicola (Macrosiphoniella sanborni) TaxID=1241865 RepID=A0A4D6YB19_9GAMM|nr:flagellar motor switch protein FliG [Buchnera aphidicola]QCI23641.1 flagellar motor switch protein FliG [Buchnera aphidicola (Macrosiphoniella sanborni)]